MARRSVRARAPRASTSSVRHLMQSVPQTGTKPEKCIHEELVRRGLQPITKTRPIADLRVTVDFVFRPEKPCVFIDGCFWHGCPDHFKLPLTNSAWWAEKVSETVQRDRRQTAKLRDAGWLVVRVWEHENPNEAVDRIVAALVSRQVSQIPKQP